METTYQGNTRSIVLKVGKGGAYELKPIPFEAAYENRFINGQYFGETKFQISSAVWELYSKS